MPSRSRLRWTTDRVPALDELEAAHGVIESATGRSRRHAARQICHAYALLLSSHFQGFCRDLYGEAAEYVVAHVGASPALRGVVRSQFNLGVKINQGNPTPGNLGADFGRFGFQLWDLLAGPRDATRRRRLEELNQWRNAIAHHDFDTVKLGRRSLRLADVRRWRRACTGLVARLDCVVGARLTTLVGSTPWK